MIRTLIIIAIAFADPVGVATCMKWQEIRPYVVGDPLIAEGEMYYFAAGG